MNEKTESKTGQRVADGIWRRENSGTLFERPKIANRWTFRPRTTKSIRQAKDELARRVTRRMAGSEPTAAVRPVALTTGQVIRSYEKDGYPDRHKQRRGGGRTPTMESKSCPTLVKFSATKRKARGDRPTGYQMAMLYFVTGKLAIPYHG